MATNTANMNAGGDSPALARVDIRDLFIRLGWDDSGALTSGTAYALADKLTYTLATSIATLTGSLTLTSGLTTGSNILAASGISADTTITAKNGSTSYNASFNLDYIDGTGFHGRLMQNYLGSGQGFSYDFNVIDADTSYSGTPLSIRPSGVIRMASLPVSAAGLGTGDLWNNGGVINIV